MSLDSVSSQDNTGAFYDLSLRCTYLLKKKEEKVIARLIHKSVFETDGLFLHPQARANTRARGRRRPQLPALGVVN